MIVKSLIDKTRHKFNVSIAEVELQDVHKNIVLGFACVTNSVQHANQIVQNVVRFIEQSTDAEIVDIVIEVL